MNYLIKNYRRINMYTLVIGRAFRAKETGMMRIFEFEQAAALNKYGMSTVYAFCDTRSIKTLRKLNYKEFTNENVPVYGYHFPIGGMPRSIFDKLKTNKYKNLLKKIIENHGKPGIIHIHFPLITMHFSIWEYLKQLNVPIVCTEHWSKVQNKEIEPFRKKLLIKLLQESDKYTTVNYELKNVILELTKLNKKVEVIPNMVSKEFTFVQREIKKNVIQFIAIGRLVKDKRYLELIKSFYNAFQNTEDVELLIIGNGPEEKPLQKLINQFDLKNKVKLMGFMSRDNVAKKLQESDIYVSASKTETFGVPYIEALACGTPIIGKKNGVIENV